MKKIFLILLVGLFAVVVAACGNLPTLESISIEGQETEFYVGEEFSYKNLVVTAKLSDATTKDVTDEATVAHNINIAVAGTYTVTVTYKSLSQTYDVIYNDNELVSIEVEGLKTEYKIGEELTFEGATVKETYENGKVVNADLTTYDVVVKVGEKEVAGAFNQVGKYTVTLAKGDLSYSYDVNVSANVYTSIADAIAAGFANAHKVSKGTSSINNDGYTQNNNYEFGEGYTKVVNPDYEETNHFIALEDDGVFGLVEGINWEGNPYVEPAYEPVVQNLLGVDYRAVVNYEYDVFGVEALVDTLAFIGVDAINYQEVINSETDKTVYAFSYETTISGYYYFISVEFSLDPNTDIINEVKVEMKGYYLVYNEETGLDEVPTEFGNPDFTRIVTVSQEAGERNAVNPYPLDEMFIESFDIVDEEGNTLENEATISAQLAVPYSLQVINVTPETANAAIDQIKVLYIDSEGNETWNVFGSYEEGYINVTAYQAGNYQIVISSANVNYTLNLVVEYSPLESFAAGVFNSNYYELVEASEATVYAGQVLEFGAIVNDGANDALVATCEGIEITKGEYYEFNAEVPGTYVITLTSEVNPELTATLTVTVEEAPSVAELLNGKYQYIDAFLGSAIYEFTPAYEGAESGVLVITYEGAYVGTGEGYFDYAYENGWLSVMPQNPGSYNCPFGVELGDAFNLVATYNYYPQGDLEVYEEPVVIEGAIVGLFAATFVHPMNQMEFLMQLVFKADGTGSYSFMNGAYEGSFAYANAEGVITFSDVIAMWGADVELSATVAENVITCKTVFTDAGNELELDYVGGNEVEEEATTTPVVGENTVFVSMMGTELYFTPEETGSYTISIDGEIAGILIEATDEWYLAEYTLELEANVTLLIVITTATWSTPEQNAVLTITKN